MRRCCPLMSSRCHALDVGLSWAGWAAVTWQWWGPGEKERKGGGERRVKVREIEGGRERERRGGLRRCCPLVSS